MFLSTVLPFLLGLRALPSNASKKENKKQSDSLFVTRRQTNKFKKKVVLYKYAYIVRCDAYKACVS